MNAREARDYLKTRGIALTCTGETLRVSPRHLVTPEVSELIQTYKLDLLTFLSTEAEASMPQGERERQRQADPGEESHVPTAVESQSPAPCSHAATYRRPSGVLVCLDCAATLAPGAPTWHPQQVVSCDPGRHTWLPRGEGDVGMLQCSQCPAVQAAQAAERPRDPAVHDPQCPGNGLVVVKGFGWSCPQCNGRYVVPEAPASSALAQVALPLGSGVPHGEVVPSKRRK